MIAAGDRVLITRLDYLGDVILSLPLVDAVRDKYPDVSIDYLTRNPAAELLATDDRFDRVFVQEPGVAQAARLIRMLRERRYRAVVDLYSNPRSAWLSRLSGAPVRVGGNRRGRRHLYTHPVDVPPQIRSAVSFHLQYGRTLGIEETMGRPVLSGGVADRHHARESLRDAGVAVDRPIIGIHPGGKWPVKRWPADRFGELARKIERELGATVAVLSGPGEEQHTRSVCSLAGSNARPLPVLPIRTVAGVIGEIDALVACDGGIMHLSAALGTPTVGIFGSAEPEVWFPYESFGPYRAAFIPVECRPCHRHVCPLGHTKCLNELSVELVFRRLSGVLKGREHAGRG